MNHVPANNHFSLETPKQDSFEQASLAKLHEAEKGLPTPGATREFLIFAESLKAGEMTQNKMISAYNELVRVVKATSPADTSGYLQGHPIEALVSDFKSGQKLADPQEVCAQLLVRGAQIAEVDHNHFQVRVSDEYGSVIGQRVGDILFESVLAAKGAELKSSDSKATKTPQLTA